MARVHQRVAIVYDRVNKWGGAERVLLALHDLFPQAPLYTSVYSPTTAPWASVFPKIYTSFLNKITYFRTHHEQIPFLMPLAFEQFDFSNYEIVISVTSESAKGIIVKPPTRHICYCLTPTRYLHSHFSEYITSPIHHLAAKYLTTWDRVACQRPDEYLAISNTVQTRIKTYYHRNSQIVFPPINTDFFTPGPTNQTQKYFLMVNRLVAYKHTSQVIDLISRMGGQLLVVGTGSEYQSLSQNLPPNIKLLGDVSEFQLRELYRGCQALIVFNEEDFGLVALEAQACGRPVIGLNTGGVAETIMPSTGILVSNLADLSSAITNFDKFKFSISAAVSQAQRFSQAHFKKNFLKAAKLRA
jgi:glycosyltransferase involved in cell wall biosynthesis